MKYLLIILLSFTFTNAQCQNPPIGAIVNGNATVTLNHTNVESSIQKYLKIYDSTAIVDLDSIKIIDNILSTSDSIAAFYYFNTTTSNNSYKTILRYPLIFDINSGNYYLDTIAPIKMEVK